MSLLTPMLAASISFDALQHFVNNDQWVIEQKLDGHRILLSATDGKPPVAITRNGSLYTRPLPEAIRKYAMPSGTWTLDGELVGSTFWVFDLLEASTSSLLSRPLVDRRVMLENLPRILPNHPFKLVPQASTREEKQALVGLAVKRNYEGVIVKNATSAYLPGGRHQSVWAKAKLVTTADVVVVGVHDDGKESARLALWDNGAFVDVGRCSLIGKPAVVVGDVVEVRYLYTGANGRLYQPTLLRVRTDKSPRECTPDQLKWVNKDVLEAL